MLLFSLLFGFHALAEVKRVETVIQDLGAVHKVFLSSGLISLIEFPQPIIEVRNGNPSSLKTVISQVSQKELTVYLSGTGSSPTNLIVRADRHIYLFDIIPSKTKHQDYVRIRGSYGYPSNSGQPTELNRVILVPSSGRIPTQLPSKTVRVSL